MSAIQLLDEIELARVEPGAQRVRHDTYNETYLGVVRSHSGLHNAYIKPLSGRQLINELVVSVLARSLSLPVPQGFLVIFSQADLPGSQVLGQVPRAGDGEFLGFACSEVKSLSLARRASSDKALELLITKNIELLKDTLIFDEWVANVDRHYNNILVTSNNTLSLIDHGHCFTGPDWKASDLRHADSYNNKLASRLMKTFSDAEKGALVPRCLRKATEYSKIDADTALAQAHIEKLPLPANEREALSDFIKGRVDCLHSIICKRVGMPTLGLVS